jgi:hypothetical protein
LAREREHISDVTWKNEAHNNYINVDEQNYDGLITFRKHNDSEIKLSKQQEMKMGENWQSESLLSIYLLIIQREIINVLKRENHIEF